MSYRRYGKKVAPRQKIPANNDWGRSTDMEVAEIILKIRQFFWRYLGEICPAHTNQPAA